MSDESRLFSAGAYLLPLVGGVLVFLMRKGDGYARFHAMQSILFWIAAVVVSIALAVVEAVFRLIPVIGKVMDLVSMLFGLGVLILWLLLMWKAYKGERWKLSLIGEQAERM